MNRYDSKTLTIADFEFHTMRPDVRIAVAEIVDTEGNHSTRWLSILKVFEAPDAPYHTGLWEETKMAPGRIPLDLS